MSGEEAAVWRRAMWLAVGLAFLLQLSTAGRGPLFNETDGQYAGAARVMAAGGDWLVPENNGVPRLVKPPLLYWLMAGSMRIFGVSEFAARLPGAVATAALALIAGLIARESGGWRRGAIAAGVAGTMLGTMTLCRIVMPEPVFSAFIAASLFCFLRAGGGGRRRWVAGFWAFAGLAAFVKGPHGLLYPVVVAAVAIPLGRGAFPCYRDMVVSIGPLLVLMINVPWYALIESRYAGYLGNLFFSEHLGHVTGSDAPATSYTSVPRWLFLVLHLAWFFPWSVMVVASVPSRLRDIVTPSLWSPSVRLAAVWVAVVGGSVLLAGQRQDYYAMSLWAGVSVLAAAVLDGTRWRAGLVVTASILAAALLICSLAPSMLAERETVETARRATASLTVAGFGPEVWSQLTGVAWASLVPAILALVLGAWHLRLGFTSLLAAAASVALGAVAGTAVVSPYFSLQPIAGQLHAAAREIVFDGNIDTASSLLFYTGSRIRLVGPDPDEDHVVRTQGIGRENYLTTDEAIRRVQRIEGSLLITEASRQPWWETASGGPLRHFARCGTMVVLEGSGHRQPEQPADESTSGNDE